MEKFAIDLDKVLDDFEFNEDCAEQVASVNASTSNASSSTVKCNLEAPALKSYNYLLIEPKKTDKELDIILPAERSKDSTQLNKGRSSGERELISGNFHFESTDTSVQKEDVQHKFYKQERDKNSKVVQREPILPHETEPAPLTIYNDISQKLLLKHQNGSSSPKADNRYDKKWNQFNVKPSVSNVFSSLNEYINAPPGSSECIQAILDESEIEADLEINAIYNNKQIPQLVQSAAKDNKKIIELKETTETTDLEKEVFDLSRQDITASAVLDIAASSKVSINDDRVKHINLIKADKFEGKPVVSQENLIAETEYINIDSKEKNDLDNASSFNFNSNMDQKDKSLLKCTFEKSCSNEDESVACSQGKDVKSVEISSIVDEQTNSLESTPKVIGFCNANNLSEDELTNYLAELEEEEEQRLNEISDRQENASNTVISRQQTTDNVIEDVQSSVDAVTKPKEIEETVLNNTVETTSVVESEREEMDKDMLNTAPQNENVKQCQDKIEQGKDSHVTTNLNRLEEMVLHKTQETANDMVKLEDNSVVVDNECLSNTTNSKNSSKHGIQTFDINKGSQGDCENRMEYQVQTHNDQTSEMKMQGDAKSTSDERNVSPYNRKVLNDTTRSTEDVASTSMNASAILNLNKIHDDLEKPVRPQTLDIVLTNSNSENQTVGSTNDTLLTQAQLDMDSTKEDQGSSPDILENSLPDTGSILGKQPPFWVPDSNAPSCMLCDVKFTVFKRRHHCRACGKVFCVKCCNMIYKLEYQGNVDSRVCVACYQLLIKAETEHNIGEWSSGYSTYMNNNEINSPQGRQPNPNNPMEYCSTIPPLQQLAGGLPPPPTVMVPVGVLKREGGTKNRPDISKSVMFSDGIRPGCDLTELDMSWDLKPPYRKSGNKRAPTPGSSTPSTSAKKQNLPRLDPHTDSYIPQEPGSLPPTVTIHKGQVSYHTATDEDLLHRTLKNECEPPVMFAINRNLYAYVKILTLNCCINKTCWNITSKGLACVGQDEVILLIEVLPDETRVPKDLLLFINQLYLEALKENTVSELGFSIFQRGNLLDSREHAGFLFIRRTLQCLQKIILPPAPYLIGLLVHRWETPWAKVFPLRLVLRLGAEYRYYPCPLFSVRFRDALYFEIGHTVMKVLADFRNFAYTLPGVRGLTIHLSNRRTDVMFPKKRYDQVIKGLNNSNDHVLAYASNFSIAADSHLVCIQTNTGDESTYQTQAISMNNHPRTVTGTSFIVINGALKSSMGLSAKSSIVEDGLMVEIMPEKMEALKAALKNMQDFSIGCGRQGAPEPDETVNIKWVDNDGDYNIGVKSPIDGQPMDGVPSMRVRNGTDYKGTSRFIRWTEVFIIHSDDRPNGVHDPVDISKLSGNIAKATCIALVKLLDLLANAGLTKLGVRTNIHPDNVGYEAGSEGMKLPPIYMNSLDNELIQVLHKAAQSSQEAHTVLELIFYILDD